MQNKGRYGSKEDTTEV